MYNVQYEVILNVPVKKEIHIPLKKEKYLLYQGAVNEGRCFEQIIPAMKWVNATLRVCGTGNFLEQAKQMVSQYGLQQKIIFTGNLSPGELAEVTLNAWAGINLLEDVDNNRFSLANRFFDYIHAALPQLCSDLPGYREINEQFEVAVLTTDLSPRIIAEHLNNLLDDGTLYQRLQENCIRAREYFNWQLEEVKLNRFYKKLIG
jgi:glycosyltransferase involved in cell wall biosynthesis